MTNLNFLPVSGALSLNSTNITNKISTSESQNNFATFLKDSINQLNELQNQSDMLTNQLARGEDVDLSQVMIASQKANITMQATLEIRNKAVEAYQEMMRMSV